MNDDLRSEYDLNKLKKAVRGKYYKQAMAGTNLVLVDPDLAKVFPDSASVDRKYRVGGLYKRLEERKSGERNRLQTSTLRS